jgi:hypothetical protein
LDKAQAATASAGQNVQSNLQAINTGTAAGLAGASGADAAAQAALTQRLGGPGPASDEAQRVMQAALAATQAGSNNVATTIAGMNALVGEAAATIPTVCMGQANQEEMQRNLAALAEIAAQRKELAAQEGGLTNDALFALENQELQRGGLSLQRTQQNREYELAKKQFGESRAGRLFQQYLAEEELGLRKRAQTFQEWLGRQGVQLDRDQFNESVRQFNARLDVDWANIGLQQRGIDLEVARLNQDIRNAKRGERREQAKLKAAEYNTALEVLNNYMAPTDREYIGDEPPTSGNAEVPYQPRQFDVAVKKMRQAGVSKRTAYEILKYSENPTWRQLAENNLILIKNRRTNRKRGRTLGPAGTLSGGGSRNSPRPSRP